MIRNKNVVLSFILFLVLILMVFMSVAQDAATDCTSSVVACDNLVIVNIPAGVNVRNLQTREVDGTFQRGETSISGWFDADGTPFASLSNGLWLVIGEDQAHAVLASLVSEADGSSMTRDEAIATEAFAYDNGKFIPASEVVIPTATPIPTPVPTLDPANLVYPDMPDEVAIKFLDSSTRLAHFVDGAPLEITEEIVSIDSESLLPVPLGLLERGDFPAIDPHVRWEAGDREEFEYPEQPIAGILMHIKVPDERYPDQKDIYMLTQTMDKNWVVIKLQVSFSTKLVPVDDSLNLITPVEDIPYVDILVRLDHEQDRIYAGGFDADVFRGEEIILIVKIQDQYSNYAGYINWRANFLHNGIKGKTVQADATEWEQEGASIIEVMQGIDDGRVDPDEALIYGRATARIFYRQDQ